MLNRRLMMAQKKAGPPPGGGIVTDGLVLWLDGSDRGGVPGHWIDLIRGIDFSVLHAEETENGIIFRSSSNSLVRAGSIPDYIPRAENGTIECAFNSSKASNTVLFAPDIRNAGAHNDQMTLGYYDGIWIRSNNAYGGRSAYKAKTFLGPSTISLSSALGIQDKEVLAVSGSSYYAGSQHGLYEVGSSGNNYHFNGIVHEVRIYNRHLTKAEILQNQQHDFDTYFGGVTP